MIFKVNDLEPLDLEALKEKTLAEMLDQMQLDESQPLLIFDVLINDYSQAIAAQKASGVFEQSILRYVKSAKFDPKAIIADQSADKVD